MVRYGFDIRTRTGQRVDRILILAASLTDAERRLRQMYLHCEIVEHREHKVKERGRSADRRAAATGLCAGKSQRKTGTQ